VFGTGATGGNDAAKRGLVLVKVADTGSGMTEEVRRKAFEPFYTTKGAKGHGLGLPSTLAILDSHGGTIEVSSTPSQGAEFRITLPLCSSDGHTTDNNDRIS
jgi:signal transduction histidine kinase